VVIYIRAMGLPRENIVIPPELEGRLQEISQWSGEPAQAMVERALADFLEDMEDVRIAEQRLAEIRSGKVKTVPLSEVMRRHGLAD
jgi:RHH-type rel operon transcriptional repressor/antitoxin RelB